MLRRRLAPALIGLLLLALVGPVGPVLATTTFAITGHLTNSATGDPVPDCLVNVIDETTGLWFASSSASDRTDAAGAYTLTGLDPATTYTVHTFDCTTIGGVYVGEQTGVGGPAGSTQTVDLALVASPAAQLTVTVLSPADDPIVGCWLGLQAPSSELYATRTTDLAGQGSWTLQPGTYKLVLYGGANCPGPDTWYLDAATAATATPIVLAAGPTPITWHLPVTPTTFAITGHLTNSATGDPVPDCLVNVIDETTGLWFASSSASDRTDAAGAYTLTGLDPATTYTVHTFDCTTIGGVYVGEQTGVGGPAGSTQTVDLALVASPAAQLTVTVLSPADDPIVGCWLGLQAPSSELYATRTTDLAGQGSWTLQPGTYKLVLYGGANCPGPDTWYLDAATAATATPIVLAAGPTPITWHPAGSPPPPTFSVSGHLSNADGDPLDCSVDAIDQATGLGTFADAVGGAYVISDLDRSATYTLRARGCVISPTLAYLGEAWPTSIAGSAGDRANLDFTLEATTPAELTFTVLSTFDTPYAGCGFGIVDVDAHIGQLDFTDANGEVSLLLAPGNYRFSLPFGCDGNPQTFFDGAATPAEADIVALEPGSTSITWHPYPATTFAVSGHVSDQNGDPLDCWVHAIDPTTGFTDQFVQASGGSYTLVDLDPGKAYAIRTRGCLGEPGVAYPGVAWPDAVQGDAGDVVAGVDFVLTATSPAVFTLDVRSSADVGLAGCSLNLIDVDAAIAEVRTLDGNGQLLLTLPPGNYKFGLPFGCDGNPSTYYDGKLSGADADVVALPSGPTGIAWYPYGSPPPSDLDAPVVVCDPAPSAWQDDNVTIHCTASDDGSGLAVPGDASFDLTTSVPAGTADGTASTDSRSICDAEGNCATAGPVTAIQVDRADPTVSITFPADGATVIIGAAVTPAASCGDVGSGIASCTVSALDTATIGVETVTATATDAVGRTAQASIQVTVRYGTCGASTKFAKNGLATLTFKVCNATGTNLSSASLGVVAAGLTGPSGEVPLVPHGTSFVYVAKSRSYQLVFSTTGLPRASYELAARIGTDPVAYPLGFRIR